MMEKTNQPYSYMIQDVERTEKELNSALKKMKVLEDEIKRLKKENESLMLVIIL
jgi:septal ring factor EnvC (AmiA/AmiB activator)